MTFYNIKITKL